MHVCARQSKTNPRLEIMQQLEGMIGMLINCIQAGGNIELLDIDHLFYDDTLVSEVSSKSASSSSVV